MAPPVYLSVRTLGELLRSRQVSPVELTTIFLDRLESLGPTYNGDSIHGATVRRERHHRRGEHLPEDDGLAPPESPGNLGIAKNQWGVVREGVPGTPVIRGAQRFGGLSCLSGSCGIR
jgi:hypothetical protein